ncbi:hypothetical protein BU26DRAFT_173082 [Trematosphaeria pertusa]|uniref:F-box domain-containing protein n=1 Tax=Trematosphaeria pertusa TaxID=390896 RepID=A0A6A6HVY8_9PLEO|nr:uncharacterized protein BU26DRAFT_173082 [Trematosphaeria pertusa]KAF2241570.1 hypothetical protein BU26DRAFT_173082 [Trematosphaeria pertusa]
MACYRDSEAALPDPPHLFFEEITPSPRATAASPLFRIPTELRELIYDDLWEGVIISGCVEGACKFRVEYGETDNDGDPEHLLPVWLFTAKQILAEGMRQFYRKARCTHYWKHENEHCGVDSPSSTFRLLSLYRIREIGSRAKLHHVLFAAVADLKGDGTLTNALTRVDNSHDGAGAEKWVNVEKPKSPGTTWAVHVPEFDATPAIDLPDQQKNLSLEAIVEHLCLGKNALRELSLSFVPPMDIHSTMLFARQSHIDLSYLERLGTNLDRVHFVLETPIFDDYPTENVPLPGLDYDNFMGNTPFFHDYDTDELPLRMCADLYLKTQQELERLARHLVGGTRGAGVSVRDWTERSALWESIPDSEFAKFEARAWHLEVRRIATRQCRGAINHYGLDCFFCEGKLPADDVEFYEKVPHDGDLIVFKCKEKGKTLCFKRLESFSG